MWLEERQWEELGQRGDLFADHFGSNTGLFFLSDRKMLQG